MIKVKGINKYFNLKRKNEIHVVKNISLELPNTGLVSLLGASGSGKTTLLNILSGLDKPNSGSVSIDENEIKKYNERQWNKYRNVQFGYIFQNYLLIQDLTVYENLEFVLKPFKLTKDEIDERIEYALKSVGMDRFKKRKPSQLSGGQQQRVAIARALVKSPDVYIADEPTGNTDEKNTTQIMNILKKISKSSLVILVTHERRLANFYSDRIIEIKDGEIVADYLNTYNDAFAKYDDRNLYLQDYEKQTKSINDIDINFFKSKQNSESSLELNIIYEDDTYYIHSAKKDVKIKFVDENDEIKVINSKRPVIKKADIEDFDYDLPKIDNGHNKKRLFFKLKDTIQIAIGEVKSMKPIQKIMFIIFFLTSILFTYGIAAYNESNYLDERIFLNYHRDLIEFNTSRVTTLEDLNEIKTIVNGKIILPHRNNTYIRDLRIEEFSQRKATVNLTRKSAVPLEAIDNPQLILGKMPKTPFEMAIDIYLLDQLLASEEIRNTGIKTREQFLGIEYAAKHGVYTIVGIIDNNNPNFYLTLEGYKLMAMNGIFPIYDQPLLDVYVIYDDVIVEEYILFDDSMEYTETLAELPLANNQILVSTELFSMIGNYQPDRFNAYFNGVKYEIVGVYTYKGLTHKSFYIQKHHLDDFYDISLLKHDNLYIIDANKTDMMETFAANEIDALDIYKLDFDSYKVLEKDHNLILYSTLMMILNVVFLFFIMRSGASSRFNKIGIYRSLGVSRMNIIRIFLFEIIIITLISSLSGVIVISLAMLRLNTFVQFVYYPLYIPFISFAIILGINMIVGIIPIVSTLRQTPAQILSRYDL